MLDPTELAIFLSLQAVALATVTSPSTLHLVSIVFLNYSVAHLLSRLVHKKNDDNTGKTRKTKTTTEKSSWCRDPEEPGPTLYLYPSSKGLEIPKWMDFSSSSSDDGWDKKVLHPYIETLTKFGLEVTDIDSDKKGGLQEYIEQTETVHGKVTLDNGQIIGQEVRVDVLRIAGTSHPELKAVRHSVEWPCSAETAFAVLEQLNYTSAVDAYTYSIELLQELQADGTDWIHVVRTSDQIMPFGFSVREFCTLDFVQDKLLVSRSCLHPQFALTSPPLKWYNSASRSYRVPLMYFARVLPIGPDRCRVVNFQFSDVGGVVPPVESVKAIRKFGVDSFQRLFQLVHQVQHSSLKVARGNPLKPSWRQKPEDMIPGLKYK